MKTLFALTFLFLLTIPFNAQSGGRLRQVKNRVVVQKPAPRASITNLVDFMNYVKSSKPDIVDDEKAQERWLTKSLRKKLMDSYKARVEYMSKHPDDKPEYPGNSTFTGVWNQPTTFSIISGRQYDYRNKDNANAKRVIIDVLYEWGYEETMENQYPGIRNLRSYIFVYEDKAWKLEDIYGYNDEFTTAGSLLRDLDERWD